MAGDATGYLCLQVPGRVHLTIISYGLRENRASSATPPRVSIAAVCRPGGRIYFLESLAFGFQAGSGVDVVSRLSWPSQSRITVTSTPSAARLTAVACRSSCGETHLPASDGPLGRNCHVFLQLEANAGGFERITIAIRKDRLAFSARSAF